MKDNWDDCDVDTQAMILAFSLIREYEDNEAMAATQGVQNG